MYLYYPSAICVTLASFFYTTIRIKGGLKPLLMLYNFNILRVRRGAIIKKRLLASY